MTSVENFVRAERRKETAQKRGGGAQKLSIEDQDMEEHFQSRNLEQTDPAAAFDRHWAMQLLETVFATLRSEMEKLNKLELFEALQPHLWGDATRVPYAELAERFGITQTNLKVIAHRTKHRYRELLRECVLETVENESDLDDELRNLMSAVSS